MGYRFDKLRVLVVDDSKPMRALLRGLLGAMGVVHIAEAADGEQGFDKATGFAPDIVITDWMMEPVDGIELIRRLRTDPASTNPFVPVIMMTGHTERERVIEARDAGMTEFLAKPIATRALYARIVSIIDNPRPFVRTKSYFGPDRRRKFDSSYNGPERRGALADELPQEALTATRDRLRGLVASPAGGPRVLEEVAKR